MMADVGLNMLPSIDGNPMFAHQCLLAIVDLVGVQSVVVEVLYKCVGVFCVANSVSDGL